jgi:hypothetical protein
MLPLAARHCPLPAASHLPPITHQCHPLPARRLACLSACLPACFPARSLVHPLAHPLACWPTHLLAGPPGCSRVRLPALPPACLHANHLYVMLINRLTHLLDLTTCRIYPPACTYYPPLCVPHTVVLFAAIAYVLMHTMYYCIYK